MPPPHEPFLRDTVFSVQLTDFRTSASLSSQTALGKCGEQALDDDGGAIGFSALLLPSSRHIQARSLSLSSSSNESHLRFLWFAWMLRARFDLEMMSSASLLPWMNTRYMCCASALDSASSSEPGSSSKGRRYARSSARGIVTGTGTAASTTKTTSLSAYPSRSRSRVNLRQRAAVKQFQEVYARAAGQRKLKQRMGRSRRTTRNTRGAAVKGNEQKAKEET